jgi:hypothetical protein
MSAQKDFLLSNNPSESERSKVKYEVVKGRSIEKRKLKCRLRRLKATHSIINFIVLNATFGSPPSEDLTGQAIMNHQSNNQLIRISSVSFGKVIVEGKKIGG